MRRTAAFPKAGTASSMRGLAARAILLCLIGLSLARCSAPAEQPLLSQFFAQSRLRDRTALTDISTVIFEPMEDGIVTTFEITGVSAEPAGGAARTKTVTLKAPVQLPSGQVEWKMLVATMERRSPPGARDQPSRWIITGVAAFQR